MVQLPYRRAISKNSLLFVQNSTHVVEEKTLLDYVDAETMSFESQSQKRFGQKFFELNVSYYLY